LRTRRSWDFTLRSVLPAGQFHQCIALAMAHLSFARLVTSTPRVLFGVSAVLSETFSTVRDSSSADQDAAGSITGL
jgi:hypothetical protein